MTIYLVRARPRLELLDNLKQRLQSGEILKMEPFGRTLHKSLENAKMDTSSGYAVWEEEDYCSPPLYMERNAILDQYFSNIEVQQVPVDGDAWRQIGNRPSIWSIKFRR